MLAVVVQMADAGKSDIEYTAGHLGDLQRTGDKIEQFAADLHRPPARLAVDPGQLAVFLVRTHGPVDAPHLRHHRGNGLPAPGFLLGPQLHPHQGAHDGLLITDPPGAGPRRDHEKHEQKQTVRHGKRPGRTNRFSGCTGTHRFEKITKKHRQMAVPSHDARSLLSILSKVFSARLALTPCIAERLYWTGSTGLTRS